MHDSGAGRQVSTEAHAIGVGNAHTRWHNVIGHTWELVKAVNIKRATTTAFFPTNLINVFGQNWPDIGPCDIGQQAECTIKIESARLGQTMREQVQSQVHINRVGRCSIGVNQNGRNRNPHSTQCVVLIIGETIGGRSRFAPTKFVKPSIKNGSVIAGTIINSSD